MTKLSVPAAKSTTPADSLPGSAAGWSTLPGLLLRNATDRPNDVALREKDLGIWKEFTWSQYIDNVRDAAYGFLALGAEPGKDSIAILAENCPEWLFADLAAQSMRLMSAGIYPTNTSSQVEFILGHSRSRFVVLHDQEQLDKVLDAGDRLDHVQALVVIEQKGLVDYDDPRLLTWDRLLELGRTHPANRADSFAEEIERVPLEGIAILVYTSGTTGDPKGAMISHRNIAAMSEGWLRLTPLYAEDSVVSYLPLCHILERCMSVAMALDVGYVVHFGEGSATIQRDIRQLAPTIFVGVPRIWEKLYNGHVVAMDESSWLNRRIYRWGFGVASKVYRASEESSKSLSPWLRAQRWIADLVVLRQIRDQLGLRRAHFLMCGAAPVAPEILRFFKTLGLDIREAYGQTENSGLASIHTGQEFKYGTVGRVSPLLELRFAPDGEILLRGPAVFAGYLNDPEATSRAVIDGWLHTGDVGELRDGLLAITDRKKDIIITSGGKNLSPQVIENELKISRYIREAIVIGERRKFVSALVEIDYDNTGMWAEGNGIAYTTYKDLATKPEVAELIESEIARANESLAQVEKVKRFRILERQLDEDDREVTATMKVRRNVILERFEQVINDIYQDVS